VVVFLITDYYSMKLVYAVIFDVVLCRPITVLFFIIFSAYGFY